MKMFILSILCVFFIGCTVEIRPATGRRRIVHRTIVVKSAIKKDDKLRENIVEGLRRPTH